MSSINRIAHFYIMKKYFLTLVILCVVSLQLSAVSVPQWITAFENQNATNSWICFQKEFNINAVPAKALTRIAADSKYWLWIRTTFYDTFQDNQFAVNPKLIFAVCCNTS